MSVQLAAEAEFYERRYADVGEALEDNYRPLYMAALDYLPVTGRIVELGCGSGTFARLALEYGCDYQLGIDFAPALIEAARKQTGEDLFRVADLRTTPIPKAECYVMLEILEHLDDDLGLLRRLPKRSRVVLSVPSFKSASHVRTFPKRRSARDRYAGLIAVNSLRIIPIRDTGSFFTLIAGVRR